MNTKHPMRGLLLCSFYTASGSTILLLLALLALAGAFVVTGTVFFFNMSVIYATTVLPLQVITGMASNEGKWERFQLSMPIKRSDLIRVHYISLVLSGAVVPLVLISALTAVGVVLYGDIFDQGFAAAMITSVPAFGMPFLISGLCFPLACSKLGKGREGGILSICFFFAIGIMMLVPQMGDWFNLSFNMLAVLIAAVSVSIFLVSYPITRMMYNKMDF